MIEIVAIDTPALGDRTYLVHDGAVAVVIDPQRDIDRVLGLAAARGVVILDVRRDQEWNDSHLAGAVHIPIHQLPSRLAEVPAGEVWVHCEAGYRASVAASVLDAAGRTVVAVDDEYERAARAGLPLEGHLAHAAAS